MGYYIFIKYHNHMRDYDMDQLKKDDERLYAQKMLQVWLWHGLKMDKKIAKKHIHDIDMDENKRAYLLFLFEQDTHHEHTCTRR